MSENMSYAAYCKDCGHLCGAVIDNPDHPERAAKCVMDFILDGLIVARVSDEVIRAELSRCTCKDGDDDADQS